MKRHSIYSLCALVGYLVYSTLCFADVATTTDPIRVNDVPAYALKVKADYVIFDVVFTCSDSSNEAHHASLIKQGVVELEARLNKTSGFIIRNKVTSCHATYMPCGSGGLVGIRANIPIDNPSCVSSKTSTGVEIAHFLNAPNITVDSISDTIHDVVNSLKEPLGLDIVIEEPYRLEVENPEQYRDKVIEKVINHAVQIERSISDLEAEIVVSGLQGSIVVQPSGNDSVSLYIPHETSVILKINNK